MFSAKLSLLVVLGMLCSTGAFPNVNDVGSYSLRGYNPYGSNSYGLEGYGYGGYGQGVYGLGGYGHGGYSHGGYSPYYNTYGGYFGGHGAQYPTTSYPHYPYGGYNAGGYGPQYPFTFGHSQSYPQLYGGYNSLGGAGKTGGYSLQNLLKLYGLQAPSSSSSSTSSK